MWLRACLQAQSRSDSTKPSMAQNHQKLIDWPLPVLGLGTAAWMSPFPAIPKDQAAGLVRFMLDRGQSFFDTSPLYGRGKSEEWLGEVREEYSRERAIISTKAGYVIEPGEEPKPRWARTEWTRENMLRSVDASLERLRTDYVDIVHLHDPDCCPADALNIAFPALAELREQGVIRAIGAGMNQWEMLVEFAQKADFDCFLLAGRYTLLEQQSLPLLDLCLEKGIALFLGGVYNTGILATGAQPGARYNYHPAPPEILERVSQIETICAAYDVSLRAAALQFPLAHPAVRSLVVGAQSVTEFSEAVSAAEMPVPTGFWDELRADGLISTEAPVPGEKIKRA
jgi:D-threo-aldose 1-dehydrogenase